MSNEHWALSEWAQEVGNTIRAAHILADYVAQIIDYHQGWRNDMPHTDLEALGGAVSAVRKGTT